MPHSEKIENILNLSQDITAEERRKSAILESGYQPVTQTWEVIVKYSSWQEGTTGLQRSIEVLEESVAGSEVGRIIIEPLLAGYAILTVPEELLDAVAALPEIEYMEKSKNLYFGTEQAKEVSCINQITLREPYLTGEGVIVAIIDSGIDFSRRDFRNPNGSTRIISLWDQSLPSSPEKGYNPPEGFAVGTEFTEEMINRILDGDPAEGAENGQVTGETAEVPSIDLSGHGTAVAAIAAGSISDTFSGVATNSRLLVVKLGNARNSELSSVAAGFPKTTELMRAVTYCVIKAQRLFMPIVINLSFGNTYGDHYGNTLLERFLDNAAEVGRTVICVGSGNEASSGGHHTGIVTQGQSRTIELSIAPYERSLSIQLWKNYSDRYLLTIENPNGEAVVISGNQPGTIRYRLGGTVLLCFIGTPQPYSVWQEYFFSLIPVDEYIDSGIWNIGLTGVEVVTGEYSLYLTSQAVRNSATRFVVPTPQVTLTIPSTAAKVITVGAYDTRFDSYAEFSGRGYVFRQITQSAPAVTITKPDLAAPGVNILTASVSGGYQLVSGTSFATPFVTGAVALLMEWGIVRGNDPYLYGEKVKAYLIRGAREIMDAASVIQGDYPNPQTGWGALCVNASLPL